MSTINSIQPKNRNSAEDDLQIGRLFGVLCDHKWLIFVFVFVFVLIGSIYAFSSASIYMADALVQVEKKNAGLSGLSDITGLGDVSSSDAATEIELLTSRMILGQAVDELNLDIIAAPNVPYGVSQELATRLGWSSGSIQISRFNVPPIYEGVDFTLLVSGSNSYQLIENNSVILNGKVGELARGSNGISLLVTDLVAKNGQSFIISKQPKLVVINKLQQTISVLEKGKQTGILTLSLEGENREAIRNILDAVARIYVMKNVERNAAEAEKSILFLQEKIPEIRESLESSELKLNTYRQQNGSVDLNLEAKAVLEGMVNIEKQLNDLTFKESEISQRFTKSHPAYIAMIEKKNILLKEKERVSQNVQKLPRVQQEVLRLTRDVQVGQEIYLQLLNKVQELNIMKAGTVGNVRVIDNAVVSVSPIKPKKKLIIVMSTLLGLMISIAFVLFRSLFNRGVESPDELEKLGINVYASVPLSEWQQEQSKKHKKSIKKITLAQHNPADLSIEALRNLRTSLHFAMMEARNNVLMITGPSPGIGKSFITSNLAFVIAQGDQKVLLVDADMRKGNLHDYFSVDKTGLSDYLSGQKDRQSIIINSKQNGLDFIARGQVPPNPSELLMHPRFAELLEWASQNYDLVLIDTPPILAVTDAAIVGRLAGTTLLVARFAMTVAKEVEITQRRLEQNGIEIKGAIFNAMEKNAASYYSGNYGYYQYNYQSSKN
ncbi:polysaccharide biosynthesis tyrosine autokinase [Enterobacter hormaechei]|uniref:polysaccharide biosynthesis tyrosine autokinase n=1 Tax=Enterobacter hormaechei TaxID=158836 RepID=UPI003D72F791